MHYVKYYKYDKYEKTAYLKCNYDNKIQIIPAKVILK